LWNLAIWKDVATVQVEILVEVEGGDDPSGVALGPIQAIPNHPIKMPTAHIMSRVLSPGYCGTSKWILVAKPAFR
jgi:hypothetical protein